MSSSPPPTPLRVVIVSQYFRPEDVQVPVTLADDLAARGHHVIVVTGWPNYPSGRLFDGHRQRLRHVERQGRVTVRRVPLYVDHSSRGLARMANYLSFAVMSILSAGVARRADVCYVYATQMTATLGPWIWRRLFGLPYVLHVQDLWPESIVDSGMLGRGASRSVEAILVPWLRRVYGQASGIVALGPTMTRLLSRRGAAPGRLSTVFNWAPADRVPLPRSQPLTVSESEATQATHFVYAGNLGDLQDLDVLLNAMAQLGDDVEARLTIAGDGTAAARLRSLAAELELTTVQFLGQVDPEQMRRLNHASDFQIVSLKGLEIFKGTIPSKFQNSLASGIPVVTTVHGDVSDLVTAHGLGYVARPSDAASLAEALRQAAAASPAERAEMGSRASRFYRDRMSQHAGVSAIEAILQEARRPDRSSHTPPSATSVDDLDTNTNTNTNTRTRHDR